MRKNPFQFTFHPRLKNQRRLSVTVSFTGMTDFLENRSWEFIKEIMDAKLHAYCSNLDSGPLTEEVEKILDDLLHERTKLFEDSYTKLHLSHVYQVPEASDFQGKRTPGPTTNITIPAAARSLGIYIAGNPGFGKSSLIQNLVIRNIRNRKGVCVIDPTSDLTNRLIAHIPKKRVDDTVLFDSEFPIPIDFFSYRGNRLERRILTNHLLDIFNLDNAPISRPLLERIISTLFDANENGATFSLLDIYRFVTDPKFQDTVISVANRKSDWGHRPKIADYASIIGRLQPFAEFPFNKVFEGKNPINIADIIEGSKVLLINLHQTPSDYFLASLIAARFQHAIFRREKIPIKKRTPFYLYIDECHEVLKYAAKDFGTVMTGGRKYNLCYTMCNQIPSDLPKEIRRKLGIVQTFFLFNLEYEDASIFSSRLGTINPESLLDLDQFQAICRTGKIVSKIRTPRPLGPSKASYAQRIKKRISDEYGLSNSENNLDLSQDGNADATTPKSAENDPPTLESDES